MFTKQDLEQIYRAAWEVGACNLLGLATNLPDYIKKARNTELGDNHPAIKLLLGHMSFLAGASLGPDEKIAEEVKAMIDGFSYQVSDTLESETYFMGNELFRKLDSNEEQEFRKWASENKTSEWWNKKDILHPVVRDQWQKEGYLGE